MNDEVRSNHRTAEGRAGECGIDGGGRQSDSWAAASWGECVEILDSGSSFVFFFVSCFWQTRSWGDEGGTSERERASDSDPN